MKTLKLTPEQRKKASIDLTLTYISNYYAEWRYAKVLTLKKLIENRYDFFDELKGEIKSGQDPSGEATIAQELRHGLYFDAIAQCIQYIEDLFALIKASAQPDFFIKNVITYKGGEVTAYLKKFKPNDNSIAEAFHIPSGLDFGDEKQKESYSKGLEKLSEYVQELIQFFIDYEFLYNQYKHGLSVALRPFGNVYNQQQIDSDKNGDSDPYLAAYDNMNLEAAFKKGTARVSHGIFMPGFTDNVAPYVSQLARENNFLRLVHPVDFKDFNIDLLVKKAKMTSYCIKIFIYNYGWKIKPDGIKRTFELPGDYLNGKVTGWSYDELPDG